MFASDFESEERVFRNRKTSISVIVTVLVHALLLLFLILSILHTPIPPFEDNAGGMSVNYGTDEVGTGDIQPFTYNPGPTEAKSSAPAKSQPETNTPDQVLTQDVEPSDVVVKKTEEKPKHKPKVEDKTVYKPHQKTVNNNATTASKSTPDTTPQQKVDPNSVFHKGAYGNPNNSHGDGTGGGQGDQGKPNGNPESHNYTDGGEGTGKGPGRGDLTGFDLKGRSIVYSPKPEKCNSTGKVVIGIKVDRSGKVIEATFKRFASTVFDECNKTNALNAARKATFNPDPNAPEIQEGSKTYIFKVE
ncbi:MAG: energy transducer TonB [Sphingobacteriales bacterium]